MQPVIIGREGVIHEARGDGAASLTDWRPIRGSLEAIARLHRAGWRVIVAYNQPAISDGTLEPNALARQHDILHRRVMENGGVIDAIFYCPHPPGFGCNCHLPAPGLLYDIASRLRTRLVNAPVIGDSLDYVQAALTAGAIPLLVKTGKGFGTVSQPQLDASVPVFNDLYSATSFLLSGDQAAH